MSCMITNQVCSQQILPAPLSPRITKYHIKAQLDPDAKTVRGELSLDWRNPSTDTVSDMQFHLYLNAFKNSASNMMSRRMRLPSGQESWGYCDIEEIVSGDGDNLASGISYIQTDEPAGRKGLELPDEKPLMDDIYEKDQTVVNVRLHRPVLPDSSIRVKIKFVSKLPRITSRTGYSGDYFFVAQWFPKLGVYEPAGMRGRETGGWNCHQFHPSSEFYANHSLYEVDITLPEEYTFGSGGQLVREEAEDGMKTLSFRAEDIVDFAWTASKKYQIAEDQWRHVKIRCLLQPEHSSQADRHIKAARHALEYLSEHVGPYPWPYLTIVDPPTYAQGAAGMEYTTLITAGTFYNVPEGIRLLEMVTVHEFGHAYFMGILASNEFEDPWLDEGINSYWENRIMDWAYGEKTSMIDFPFVHAGDVEFARISWLESYGPDFFPTSNNSWSFPRGTYGPSVYQKPATMLNTLERIIGQECMDEIFKRYYQRWAFRHPATKDFTRVANEVTAEVHGTRFGKSLDWFFDQFLYGTARVDYGVRRITNMPARDKGGFFDRGDGKAYRESQPIPDMYHSVVQLERAGDGIIPVEVLIRFDNGDEILESWDGKDRTRDLIYDKPVRVVSAIIDPGNKILLDGNFLNNSFTIKPKTGFAWKWAARFLFLIQNLMQSLSLFI